MGIIRRQHCVSLVWTGQELSLVVAARYCYKVISSANNFKNICSAYETEM